MTILPVIHYCTKPGSHDIFSGIGDAMNQADLALRCGANGVMVIAMQGLDKAVGICALHIKKAFPAAHVGINLLRHTAGTAYYSACAHEVDSVWMDRVGIYAGHMPAGPVAYRDVCEISGDIAARRAGQRKIIPQVFAPVAFKGDFQDTDPARTACKLLGLGFVPTTSGMWTGVAPDLDKIRGLREAIGPDADLACASGLTPDNIAQFRPYITHALVATGVTEDGSTFKEDLLRRFVENSRT